MEAPDNYLRSPIQVRPFLHIAKKGWKSCFLKLAKKTNLNHLAKAKPVRLHFVGQFPANLLLVSPRRGAHAGKTAKALGLVDDEEEDIVDVLKNIFKNFLKIF